MRQWIAFDGLLLATSLLNLKIIKEKLYSDFLIQLFYYFASFVKISYFVYTSVVCVYVPDRMNISDGAHMGTDLYRPDRMRTV